MQGMLSSILAFIIIFGSLVLFHELGHFVVAKMCHVLVLEFSIGMGPKLFQYHGRETTYTIRWFPIGGYVRLASKGDAPKLDKGQPVLLKLDDRKRAINIMENSDLNDGIPIVVTDSDLEDKLFIKGYENGDEKQEVTYKVNKDATVEAKDGTISRIAPKNMQFKNLKYWQQLLTNSAGPAMNILTGIIALFIFAFVSQGQPTNTLSYVKPNEPAYVAGIRKGDTITKINGRKINDFNDIAQNITFNQNKPAKITVVTKKGKIKHVTVTPKKIKKGKETLYLLGITAKLGDSFAKRWQFGVEQTKQSFATLFNALIDLFRSFSLNKLNGPVGIFTATKSVGTVAQTAGWQTYLTFFGMLAINLGICNLIPIPGLDGGKCLINLIEMITRKNLPEKYELVISFAGFVLLMLLMIVVTINDIFHL